MSPGSTVVEHAGVQKRMRKGTKSCLNCRRRKIRCSGSVEHGACCVECKARGDNCLAQGILSQDDAVVAQRLKQRVAHLEARLQSYANTGRGSSSSQDTPETATQALKNLLSGINAAAHYGASRPITSTEDPEQEEQEDIDTSTAPLMQLLNNSALGTTPEPSDSPAGAKAQGVNNASDRMSARRRTAKYVDAVRELASHLPAEAEREDIFQHRSCWWPLYRDTLGLVWGDADRLSLRSFATQALTDGHPSLLGLLLVSFAISTGDLQKYLPPVERRILNDDEYAGTEYGLNCLMALGLCYMTSLQPRRAWTVYRRANTLLQLNGLHLRHKSEKHELLFWQLFHADRWVSLMIGLPYMVEDHFCDLTISPIDTISAGTWLYRQLGVVTGRVVDCLQSTRGPNLSAALKVEEQMEYIHSQLPPNYLDLSQIRNCSNLTDKYTRLYRVVHFHHLRAFVHLPFLLRSATQDRHAFSRRSCISDSRQLLDAYLEIFDSDPKVAANGTVLNFTAFTAAVVVLLGLIKFGRPNPGVDIPTQPQVDQDWRLIYRVKHAIKFGIQNQTAGILCRKCHTALELLVSSATSSSGEPAKRVVLPYFGTLLITRQNSHGRSDAQGSAWSSARDVRPSGPDEPMYHCPWVGDPNLPSGNTSGNQTEIPNMSTDQNLDFDMSFAYQGPFLPESNPAVWPSGDQYGTLPVPDAGNDWYDNFSRGIDWNWLTADLPPNFGL